MASWVRLFSRLSFQPHDHARRGRPPKSPLSKSPFCILSANLTFKVSRQKLGLSNARINRETEILQPRRPAVEAGVVACDALCGAGRAARRQLRVIRARRQVIGIVRINGDGGLIMREQRAVAVRHHVRAERDRGVAQRGERSCDRLIRERGLLVACALEMHAALRHLRLRPRADDQRQTHSK